tara:strand:- start:13 stop:912 length:900 start_codon:yes stop_codon:yes gene_type:complete
MLKPLNQSITKNGLTVFCYHDVSSNPSEFSEKFGLNVYPEEFNFQINFINRNFNVISPDDLIGGQVPENAAMITFDDGFRSYFKNAVPILEKYNSPSMIFLNMAPVKGDIFFAGLITYLCDKSSEFRDHIFANTNYDINKKPLFLYCSRSIVNSYLEKKGQTFRAEVKKFVGEFSTKKDLESSSVNNLIFFGNHLYNHDVSLLLTDDELLKSFSKNENELKNYPNFRNFFAFPFGQPDTCFSKKQIELLLEKKTKKVFSTYPIINPNPFSSYLNRISLNHLINTNSKLWFSILRKSFKI